MVRFQYNKDQNNIYGNPVLLFLTHLAQDTLLVNQIPPEFNLQI